jgi:hypothetical protein
MEVLLNSVWFLVAVLATFELLRNHHRKSAPLKLWLALGVLLCTAFVLFPFISVSDDLHFDPFVIEDAKSTRRLAKATARSHSAAPLSLVPIASTTLAIVARSLRAGLLHTERRYSTVTSWVVLRPISACFPVAQSRSQA